MYLWSDYVVDKGDQWAELECLIREARGYDKTPTRARFLDGYPEDLRRAFCVTHGVEADMDWPAQSYVMIKVE